MFLQEHACQDAQGLLLSKALSAEEAGDLLRRANECSDRSRTQKLKAMMK